MILLLSSLIALAVGPLLYGFARRRNMMISLMDGFIFVTISGLVLLSILPESFLVGGWTTLVFVALGLFGPTALERSSRRSAKQTHIIALVLGITGLGLHALVDGTALVPHHHSMFIGGETLLPFAVILHRFPVGLTLWWLLRPSFGRTVATATLGLVGLATVAGYWLGPLMTFGLSSTGIAWFQAFVAGTLLHVVFHQPHFGEESCGCNKTARKNNRYEGLGALAGILLTAALVEGNHLFEGQDVIAQSSLTFWTLTRESAPALLLAYVAAGLLNAFLPPSSVQWLRKGSQWAQSLRGVALGLPLPICSCGVVPLYQTMIRKGVPATAGIAFLIATPELGLDAVLLSIPLLGGHMTLIRVIAAILVAVAVGRIVGGIIKSTGQDPALAEKESESQESSTVGIQHRLWSAVKVGFGEVVDHTAPWILVGLMVAAVAHPLLGSGILKAIPSALEVPLFALLGLPVYVCASGATPLVAVLLFNGTSPGAALAFLLTGPATNVTTFGLLTQLHGRRAALSFSLVIISMALVLGYLVNWLFPGAGTSQLEQISVEPASTFEKFCLVLLMGVYLFSVVKRGARKFVAELFFQDERALDLHPHYR